MAATRLNQRWRKHGAFKIDVTQDAVLPFERRKFHVSQPEVHKFSLQQHGRTSNNVPQIP